MTVDLTFVELHTPLFLAGTNLSNKLDTRGSRKQGLVLRYSENEEMLYVYYNRKMARVPLNNVASMTDDMDTEPPALASKTAPEPKTNVVARAQPTDPVAARKEHMKAVIKPPAQKPTAQVSGPTHHVFAGEGAGKVRD